MANLGSMSASLIANDIGFLKSIQRSQKALEFFRNEADRVSTRLKQLGNATKFYQNQFQKIQKEASKTGSSLDNLNRTAGNTRKGILSLFSSFSSLRSVLASAGIYLGIREIIRALKELYVVARDFRQVKKSMTEISGSVRQMNKELQWLQQVSNKTGQNFYALIAPYRKFLASAKETNMTFAETHKVVNAVLKASASLGLSQQNVEGIFLAMEQSLAKVNPSMEELRRQMGDHFPGAVAKMAKALNMSQKDFFKAVEEKLITSKELFLALSNVLDREYTGVLEEATETSNKFAEALDRAKIALSELILMSKAIPVLKGITWWLNEVAEAAKLEFELNQAVDESQLQKNYLKIKNWMSDIKTLFSETDFRFPEILDPDDPNQVAYFKTLAEIAKALDDLERAMKFGWEDIVQIQEEKLENLVTAAKGFSAEYNNVVLGMRRGLQQVVKMADLDPFKDPNQKNKVWNAWLEEQEKVLKKREELSKGSAKKLLGIDLWELQQKIKYIKEWQESATATYTELNEELTHIERVAAMRRLDVQDEIQEETLQKRKEHEEAVKDLIEQREQWFRDAYGSEFAEAKKNQQKLRGLHEEAYKVYEEVTKDKQALDRNYLIAHTEELIASLETSIYFEDERNAIILVLRQKLADDLKRLDDQQTENFEKELKEQEEAYKKHIIELNEYSAGLSYGWEEFQKTIENWSEMGIRHVEEMYNSLKDSTTDFFDNALQGKFDEAIESFEDFTSSIRRMFAEMLSKMAMESIAKPIIIPIVQQVVGGVGNAISGIAGQSGGGGFSLSSLGSIGGGSMGDSLGIGSWLSSTSIGESLFGANTVGVGFQGSEMMVAPEAFTDAMASGMTTPTSGSYFSSLSNASYLGAGASVLSAGMDLYSGNYLGAGYSALNAGAYLINPIAGLVMSLAKPLVMSIMTQFIDTAEHQDTQSVLIGKSQFGWGDIDWGTLTGSSPDQALNAVDWKSGAGMSAAQAVVDSLEVYAKTAFDSVDQAISQLPRTIGDLLKDSLGNASIEFGRYVQDADIWDIEVANWETELATAGEGLVKTVFASAANALGFSVDYALQSGTLEDIYGGAFSLGGGSHGINLANVMSEEFWQPMYDAINATSKNGEQAFTNLIAWIDKFDEVAAAFETTQVELFGATSTSGFEQQINSLNTQFDTWLNTLDELGFSLNYINQAEEKRAEWLEKQTTAIMKSYQLEYDIRYAKLTGNTGYADLLTESSTSKGGMLDVISYYYGMNESISGMVDTLYTAMIAGEDISVVMGDLSSIFNDGSENGQKLWKWIKLIVGEFYLFKDSLETTNVAAEAATNEINQLNKELKKLSIHEDISLANLEYTNPEQFDTESFLSGWENTIWGWISGLFEGLGPEVGGYLGIFHRVENFFNFLASGDPVKAASVLAWINKLLIDMANKDPNDLFDLTDVDMIMTGFSAFGSAWDIFKNTTEEIKDWTQNYQDLDVRMLYAQGLENEAENLQLAYEHQRELEQARLDGANADYIAYLQTVQAAEAQALYNQQLEEAAQALTNFANDVQYRFLNVLGKTLDAALFQYNITAQQEIAQAKQLGFDLNQLYMVQGLERLQIIANYYDQEAQAAIQAASATSEYTNSLKEAQEAIRSFGASIDEWILGKSTTTESTIYSPETQLSMAEAAFNQQIALIKTAEGQQLRDALQSIMGYADTYLEEAYSMYATTMPYQEIFKSVMDIMGGLEGAVSPEQYIVDAIDGLSQVVAKDTTLNSTFSTLQELINDMLDGGVDYETFYQALAGNTAAMNTISTWVKDPHLFDEGLANAFDKLDKDHNGVLTWAEFSPTAEELILDANKELAKFLGTDGGESGGQSSILGMLAGKVFGEDSPLVDPLGDISTNTSNMSTALNDIKNALFFDNSSIAAYVAGINGSGWLIYSYLTGGTSSALGNVFTKPSITSISEFNHPEAVIPLTRMGNGELGVRMVTDTHSGDRTGEILETLLSEMLLGDNISQEQNKESIRLLQGILNETRSGNESVKRQ